MIYTKLYYLLILFLVSQIAIGQFAIDIKAPIISQNNGEITVDLSGDANPFDLTISPLTTPNENYNQVSSGSYAFVQLAPGDYTIELKDRTRCITTESVNLTATDCPEVNVSILQLIHNTGQYYPNGEINLTIDSEFEVEDFTYSWTKDGGAAPQYDGFLHLQYATKGDYVLSVALRFDESCVVSQPISILDCGQQLTLSGADCPGGLSIDQYCIQDLAIVPDINLVISDVKGESGVGKHDGSISYTVFNQADTYLMQWTNEAGQKAYPINNSMITNLSAGEWCYTIENGCGDVSQDCIEVPVCTTTDYRLIVQASEGIGNGCDDTNSTIISVETDGLTSTDETFIVTLEHYGVKIRSEVVTAFPFLLDNLPNGEFVVVVESACNESPMTESFEFLSACDEQLDVDTEFKGFRFNDDCSDRSLGIFGGVLNDGFNYEIEITDQAYLESQGCDYTIRWPESEQSFQQRENFVIKSVPWQVSGDQKYALSGSTSQPVNVIVEQSNGCQYAVSRPVCERELSNSSNGVPTGFVPLNPSLIPAGCIITGIVKDFVPNISNPCEVCATIEGNLTSACNGIDVGFAFTNDGLGAEYVIRKPFQFNGGLHSKQEVCLSVSEHPEIIDFYNVRFVLFRNGIPIAENLTSYRNNC